MAKKRVALVTGGSTGLGQDIALQLQQEGFEVAVCGRRADKLAAMEARGVRTFQCDIGDREDVARMKRDLLLAFGRLDVN